MVVSSASLISRPLPPSALGELQRGFCVIPNWLPPDAVSAVLDDALALDRAGLPRTAGVGNDRHASGQRRVDDETRRSRMLPLIPPPRPSVGCADTRIALHRCVLSLREELQGALPSLPQLEPFHTELAYLYYGEGGFYAKHMDVPASHGGWSRMGRRAEDGGSPSRSALRREVSMLLYLDRGWRPEWGGALRIYPEAEAGREVDGDEAHVDIYPEGGTLVLMRSDSVPHEVLPTRRPRRCLVGWMRTMRCQIY